MNEPLDIRPLRTLDELRKMQELELKVWDMEPIPTHQTLTVAKNGGIILGGFIGETLVGFIYSFPGFHQTSVYLCSHMLGIHPDYQGKGYGRQLKLAQKEAAIRKGYKLMTWTYDPLESVNANLNIGKLQAICRTYIEDCYGEMDDALNAGLATDRFMVEWLFDSDQHTKEQAIRDAEEVHLVTVQEDEQAFPVIDAFDGGKAAAELKQLHSNQAVLVPIPTNFQQIKEKNHSLAIDWRMKTRKLFTLLFQADYVVVGIKRKAEAPLQHYILIKQSEINIHREGEE
ncbi:GNAT family N-acetyltransferase [Halalkalibacterium ligniniphilum]|uniref:GNAT family N-acetyltransferase n=1 Tax=Halalkalibacterium ligniniphilum TaxID=1134413 RepID=UPI0003481801|nr:GNAT family N-acetyltransferase [Halalkalibacterium ligniniphilum]